MNLRDLLQKDIRQQGAIPFVRFMQQALYAPNLGYYSSGKDIFGARGDFITAPELTPLFGYTLANQCQQVLSTITSPVLFEFGAGSGQLSVDILTQLERLGCLPAQYQILEVSAHLQERQRALIALKIPHLAHLVQWCSTWPTTPFSGVVIANEVLDAMPVHRFLQTKDGLLESFITLNDQDEWTEIFNPCRNQSLIKHVHQVLSCDTYPYQSEANLFIDDWIRQCGAMLERGAFFIIDYGFPRHEYYHPQRSTGTLMCHYQHHAHAMPLLHVGEQDITAHVDFTHVAEAADAALFHVAGYTNQAAFLLNNGLLNLLMTMDESHQKIQAQQAVKKLVQPNEMGELFKVMALTKNYNQPLNGFSSQDKRASL